MKRKKKYKKTILLILTLLLVWSLNSYAKTGLRGDCNFDGVVDTTDVIKILRHIASIKTSGRDEWRLEEEALKKSDVNQNGIVDITDLLKVLRYMAASKSGETARKHPDWISEMEEEKEEISPETILLNKEQMVLDINGTKQMLLKATISPSNANIGTDLTWKSSDEAIATVTQEGIVTGIANGEAIISVMTGNGGIANCSVIVQTSPIDVLLDKTIVTLDLSGKKTDVLGITFLPDTTNVNQTITWESSSPTIASVDSNGTIIGFRNGACKITGILANGKQVTCDVTVQTSPVGIYFSENREDSTAYLSVKKGETTTIKPVILPVTANVDTEITYRISSGNMKVADIDASTGEITGKQAGVVTIEAKTPNGKKANINLNVKIGNEVFDTYSTIKLKANTSNSLLYSKAVNLAENNTIASKSHLQNFAIHANGSIYYSSYIGNGEKHFISLGEPDETPIKCMTLEYFGHGSGFDVEKGSSGGKIWIDSVTLGLDSNNKYNNNYAISRLQWKNNNTYYFATGTVKIKDNMGNVLETYDNEAGENFVYYKNDIWFTNMREAVDEENRLLAIYYGRKIYIYDLDEAFEIENQIYEVKNNLANYGECMVRFTAKNLSNITPLAIISIDKASEENEILYYAWQGFDLEGDYIYLSEGYYTTKTEPKTTNGKAYVTVFDYMYNKNGGKLAKNRTEVVAVNEEWERAKSLLSLMGDREVNNTYTYNLAEIEGIKVDTTGTQKVMYLGFDTNFESTKKGSANILKYSY